MATQADVRRIALSFPETEEGKDHFAFSVRNRGKLKGFAWVWMERVTPRKPRVHQPRVFKEAWRCQAPPELAAGIASKDRAR